MSRTLPLGECRGTSSSAWNTAPIGGIFRRKKTAETTRVAFSGLLRFRRLHGGPWVSLYLQNSHLFGLAPDLININFN